MMPFIEKSRKYRIIYSERKWEWRQSDREWICGHIHIVGERESGMNGEGSNNIYVLSGVTWTAGEKLPWSAGSTVWQSIVTQRDGIGGGEGS